MKDPNNREIMTRLYRLIEKYETPPRIIYVDDGTKYFSEIANELSECYNTFKENEFAKELFIAFYNAIGERFKKVNPEPLKDRPPEPDQLKMF